MGHTEPIVARERVEIVTDVALGIFVVIVVVAAITADVGSQTAAPDALAYGIAVGMGALMLVRRQMPVAVALVTGFGLIGYYMLDYPPIGLAVPIAAALYSVAEAGRLRWAIGIGGGLVVVSTGFRVAAGDDIGYLFGYELATTVTLMAAVIALGDAVRSRRDLREEADRRIAAVATERALDADRRVAEERLRIARDLHDVLAHTLSVITVQADVAAEAVDDDVATARSAVQTIRSTARSASAEIRSTVQVLRAAASADGENPRAPAGGLADLDRLVDATRAAGIGVDVVVTGTSRRLPLTVDATALRIIQEALTNVRRHAHATTVRIGLEYAAQELRVEIIDDGVGPPPGGDTGANTGANSADGAGDSTGFGIRGMRERAELIGGTLVTGPADGQGFRVVAQLPVSD